MITVDFMLGFGAGFVVALILGGFFWPLYTFWVRDIRAPDRKQPIVHLTERTPRQVMAAAAAAWTKFFALCLFFAIGLWLFVEIAFPNFAELVHTLIGNLWTMLFG